MRDILQVIKGWYSATTYITPKKERECKIDNCNSLNRMF